MNNPESEIRYIAKQDADFPQKLREIDTTPAGLYVRGSLPDPARKSVAIVGARACSDYGRAQAIRFGHVLAEHGVQIISGMASGIDSWGHHGALAGGGATFAVLGTGVDVCYPPSSRVIYLRIPAEGGGILSEYPPGTQGEPWHFPVRNRIISGLADVVLVVEARKKSGSLITADLALEQGRSVYAVPGRNGDRTSEGCNDLILQGAGIATSPAVILAELGIELQGAGAQRKTSGKTPLERAVLRELSGQARSFDELLSGTGSPSEELAATLLSMRLSGKIVERVRGFYSCI